MLPEAKSVVHTLPAQHVWNGPPQAPLPGFARQRPLVQVSDASSQTYSMRLDVLPVWRSQQTSSSAPQLGGGGGVVGWGGGPGQRLMNASNDDATTTDRLGMRAGSAPDVPASATARSRSYARIATPPAVTRDRETAAAT